jgi:hypothetical protein
MHDRFRPSRRPARWLRPWILPAATAALLVVEASHQGQRIAFVPQGAVAIPAAAPRSCAEARALGLDNTRRGQPGYAPHLDADGDGIECEPWHGGRP